MRATVAKVVDPFLNETDRALGSAYSAVLYGSAARGDFIPGRSDINLLLVLEQLTPAILRSLSRAFMGWRKSLPEPPLILSRAEWNRASDAFPIEITDMRLSYRVLRGGDPLEGVQVDLADLRKALERELRGKMLRLRQGYATVAPDPAALGNLGLQSAATILVLLRGLLTVVRKPVSADATELVKDSASLVGFQADHVLHVVSHRADREWRCQASDFENYMSAVEQTAGYVDQLQLGDQ
jgi:predicted nucleotidyltransferase